MGRGGKRKHNTKNTLLGLPFQVISLESIMSLNYIQGLIEKSIAGQVDQAMAVLERAVQLHPDDVFK